MDARPHGDGPVGFGDHDADDRPAPTDAGPYRFDPPASQPRPDAHGPWPVVKAEHRCERSMALHGRALPIAAR